MAETIVTLSELPFSEISVEAGRDWPGLTEALALHSLVIVGLRTADGEQHTAHGHVMQGNEREVGIELDEAQARRLDNAYSQCVARGPRPRTADCFSIVDYVMGLDTEIRHKYVREVAGPFVNPKDTLPGYAYEFQQDRSGLISRHAALGHSLHGRSISMLGIGGPLIDASNAYLAAHYRAMHIQRIDSLAWKSVR